MKDYMKKAIEVLRLQSEESKNIADYLEQINQQEVKEEPKERFRATPDPSEFKQVQRNMVPQQVIQQKLTMGDRWSNMSFGKKTFTVIVIIIVLLLLLHYVGGYDVKSWIL